METRNLGENEVQGKKSQVIDIATESELANLPGAIAVLQEEIAREDEKLRTRLENIDRRQLLLEEETNGEEKAKKAQALRIERRDITDPFAKQAEERIVGDYAAKVVDLIPQEYPLLEYESADTHHNWTQAQRELLGGIITQHIKSNLSSVKSLGGSEKLTSMQLAIQYPNGFSQRFLKKTPWTADFIVSRNVSLGHGTAVPPQQRQGEIYWRTTQRPHTDCISSVLGIRPVVNK